MKSPELCKLAPLETPRALQDIKTDLVQLFLTNMASDEVICLPYCHHITCPALILVTFSMTY